MQPVKKVRADELLVQKGLVTTRSRAQTLIMMGKVFYNGKKIEKSGETLPIDGHVEIKEDLPYVSRGGLKLEAALKHFQIDVNGKITMDVGASTGGFTQCLLNRGAKKVYAIDVGYGVLDVKLRNDERVVNLEKTNIREMSNNNIPEKIHIATIDVSFISLTKVIPKVMDFLCDEGIIIALIKPQFELTPKEVGKGGIVRDSGLQKKAVENIEDFCRQLKLHILGVIPSPITGKKGNQEYLICMKNSIEKNRC